MGSACGGDRVTQFVWNASLPRSGSTLLQAIVSQNEKHHASATSGIAELVVMLRNRWTEVPEFRSQGISHCSPSIASAMRGLIEGYYRQALQKNQIVWDKSRGWLGYFRLLDEIFGERQKIVVCVRDVREIVTSFEMLFRSNSLIKKDPAGPALHESITIEGRVSHLLALDSVVGQSIAMLRDCLHTDPDRLVIVPYRELCNNPQKAIDFVMHRLGLQSFEVGQAVCNSIPIQDDSVWGLDGLHDVRPIIEQHPDRWPAVLPERLADLIASEYADINSLA
jgi:sulfotransferase